MAPNRFSAGCSFTKENFLGDVHLKSLKKFIGNVEQLVKENVETIILRGIFAVRVYGGWPGLKNNYQGIFPSLAIAKKTLSRTPH